jgi:CRISPR-associated protein Cmr6
MTEASTRREVLKGVRADQHAGANVGLWLDKYLGDFDERKKEEKKAALVKQISGISVPDIYRKFYEGRWQELLKDCGALNPREVVVSGRMAVGLGSDSVLETSIALHRTYGVPYIPASALKGLALRYARKHLERQNAKGEDIGEWKRKDHTERLFGTPSEAGYITFFDALYVPDSGKKVKGVSRPLAPDVMTVHHPKYYQSNEARVEPPADWDDPKPVPFISATGKYLIAVTAPDAEEWIEITLTILETALKEVGIGAKTSSGYGRMSLE